MRFGCEVESARWDAEAQRWQLETSSGPLTARVLIAGAGPLHEPKLPDIPGLADFEGDVFHSATLEPRPRPRGRARRGRSARARRAIQFVPADPARRSRAPPLPAHRAVGHAAPRPAPDPPRARRLPALPGAPAARARVDLLGSRGDRDADAAGRAGAAAAPGRARATCAAQVRDPELRAKLTPDYLPGCKRILVANDYLPSLGRPNVEVVTDGIAEVRGRSIVSADGTEREVDTIIFGTGFHVLDMPIAERIRDGDGRTLAERWDGSPQAHRGTTVAGYPEPVLPARAEHRPRPQLGRLHGRGAGRLRAAGAHPPARRAGSRRSTSPRRPSSAGTTASSAG